MKTAYTVQDISMMKCAHWQTLQ